MPYPLLEECSSTFAVLSHTEGQQWCHIAETVADWIDAFGLCSPFLFALPAPLVLPNGALLLPSGALLLCDDGLQNCTRIVCEWVCIQALARQLDTLGSDMACRADVVEMGLYTWALVDHKERRGDNC
mmetsp:Transcript_4302/g.10100  ORF Transcript_4302/g.10100 Transcript_4302/m.10100 type:complete len:128 (-) Transcript_4302:1297-1680(-)